MKESMPDQAAKVDRNVRKAHPLLRMVADGSAAVNLARSEQSSSIAVDEAKLTKSVLAAHRPVASRALLTSKDLLPAPSRARLAEGVKASVFIQTTSSDAAVRIEGETARRGDLVLAELPLDGIKAALAQPDVSFIEAGEALRRPRPRVESGSVTAPSASDREIQIKEHDHHFGKDVLIGIIDVDGFDFAHPDFLDPSGQTRFERIWDQGATTDRARTTPILDSAEPSTTGRSFARSTWTPRSPEPRRPAWMPGTSSRSPR